MALLSTFAACLTACFGADTPGAGQASVAIESLPVLDIPGTGPDNATVFSDPVGATRFDDGTVAIADRMEYAVHFFSATGQLIRSVGRQGDGPGEFRELTWLGRCHSRSVLVWDRMLQRMTSISVEGHASQWPFAGPVPTTLTCSADGPLAYFGPPEALPSSLDEVEYAEVVGSLYLAGVADSPATGIGILPMGEPRPLGRMTALAVSGDRLFVGTGASDEILTFALDGKPGPSIASRVPARPATAAHYDRAIARQLEMFRDPASRRMGEEMLRRIPMPDLLPAYGGVWADPEGVAWVLLSTPGDAGTWLRGLSPSNEIVADLRLAQDVRVFEIGREYLLGSAVSTDGTPHVVQFALRRR